MLSFTSTQQPQMRLLFALFILNFVFFSFTSSFAAGELDSAFRPGAQSLGGYTKSVVAQPDGKVIVVGGFRAVNGEPRPGVARFNADGTLDQSFNPPDIIAQHGIGEDILSVALQADGKIYIGGNIVSANGFYRPGAIRLNSDGSVDESFNLYRGPGLYSNHVLKIVPTTDGRVFIGGDFVLSQPVGSGSSERKGIALLNPDGSINTDFDPPRLDYVREIAIQPNGKVIVAGYNSVTNNGLLRLNLDGTIDNTFQTGFISGPIEAVLLQPDGKILIGGTYNNINGFSGKRLDRLTSTGALDVSFNSGNSGPHGGSIYDLEFTSDGKILVAGWFLGYNGDTQRGSLIKINPDGTADTSFNFPIVGSLQIFDAAIVPDGRVYFTRGTYSGTEPNLQRQLFFRANANGTLDNGFTPNIGYNGTINKILSLPDGAVIAGGDFNFANNISREPLVKFNSDGTIDTGFNPPPITRINGSAKGIIYDSALQADGKILVAGLFDAPRGELFRLNPNGTLDVTFNFPFGLLSEIMNIVLQPDGKIIISCRYFNSNLTRKVVRLNADGSLDNEFNLIAFPQGTEVTDIALQPDGKILVAGDFTQVGGVDRGRIARLNANGTLDATYNPPLGANNPIFDIALQADGKIVLAGQFIAVNGVPRSNLARMNADGSLDESFAPSANSAVRVLEIQPDGKILIAGSFSLVNNIPLGLYGRLNSNGSVDQTFNSNPGANDAVNDFALQADGKILIAGKFSRINNQPRLSIARLFNNTTPLRVQYDFDGDSKADISVFRPSTGYWFIMNSANNSFSAVQFGASGDLIAPADYDGDGKTDIAVFRPNGLGDPTRAYFFILQSASNTFRFEQFGNNVDVPVSGDWDGDSKADVAVYRAGNSTTQAYFYYRPSAQPGTDFRAIQWGSQGDKAVQADYDGDGKLDAAVFRATTQHWYVLKSSDNQVIDVQFGLSSDIPQPVDFDGDGRANFAVYRPSTGWWYRSTNPNTNYDGIQFGINGDIPVAADFDGDGRADVAVFRPSNGTWYIFRTTAGFIGQQFGTTNDIPAPAAYFR